MLSYCRAHISPLAMWGKRGRINENLLDSGEVTRMFPLVISPSLLVSSLILLYFPNGHLSFYRSSFGTALMMTPLTISVATVTADRCLVPLLQRRNAGQEVKSMHANLYTHTPHAQHGDSCIMLCFSLLYAESILLGVTNTHVHFRCPYQSICTLCHRIIRSQMTNRCNQPSGDPSCCFHIHYSWNNIYIKQSGTTNQDTHELQATLLTHMRHTHLIAHTVNTHCCHINTYLVSKESSLWPSPAHRP